MCVRGVMQGIQYVALTMHAPCTHYHVIKVGQFEKHVIPRRPDYISIQGFLILHSKLIKRGDCALQDATVENRLILHSRHVGLARDRICLHVCDVPNGANCDH